MPSISIKQVEIDRADNGARRLFRSEINNRVTGFVEKHFRDDTFVREFAIGGPKNGVDEATAKARFKGLEAPSAPAKKVMVTKPAVEAGLPDFLTQSEPVMKGKSAQARKPAPTPRPVAQKPETSGPSGSRGSLSRKEGLALAGKVLANKS